LKQQCKQGIAIQTKYEVWVIMQQTTNICLVQNAFVNLLIRVQLKVLKLF